MYQGHVATQDYPGPISASIMGTLARADMYPGGGVHGFFQHLVNLLTEVITDGIRTSALALAEQFAYVTNHLKTHQNRCFGSKGESSGWSVPYWIGIGASIYMPMSFARTSGSAGMLILLIIVVFMVPTVQAAPCP
eukprot:7383006-Prymnesium_polylepis.1